MIKSRLAVVWKQTIETSAYDKDLCFHAWKPYEDECIFNSSFEAERLTAPGE